MSASAIAAAVNAGRADPLEIAARAATLCLASQVRLNALTAIDAEGARLQAAAVRERVRSGARLPLAGVPLIVKDNIWVEGFRITQGSRLFRDHVAACDAVAVARAKAAGAVVIAIGACSEFACKGVTATPLHGVTRHPMDPRLTPGGSSGGNAAAIAAGLAPLSLGTDAGGSSRRPPAHCGVVGCKPSQGAVPHPFGFPEPFWGISSTSPITANVADARLLFEVIAGPDPRDPESRPIRPAAGADGPLRIAISADLGLSAPVDEDVADAFARAVDCLSRLRHRLIEAAPRWPEAGRRATLPLLQFAGLAALHGQSWRAAPDEIDRDVGAQIARGLEVTGAEVASALEASQDVRRALAGFFLDVDLVVSPTTPCVAWPHEQLGPARIGGSEVDPRGHAVFTPLFNHGHAPAISIPCGRGRDGLPVGLQIAGPAGSDHLVLAFAAEAERAIAEAGLWSVS